MKPANFEPGEKYPLLLYIHGGPWSLYNACCSQLYLQAWFEKWRKKDGKSEAVSAVE